MSNSAAPTIERPLRSLGTITLGLRLFSLDFSRTIRARKTIALLLLQLLPVIVATIYIAFRDLDGTSLFRNTVEFVYLPLLLPLAALFFGGPTVVNEIEGRTITYLTLRPIPRGLLYLSKLASSICATLAITVLPVLLLYFSCTLLGTSGGVSISMKTLAGALGAVATGAITYTAIFALLGVLLFSSLLLGIVYFIVVELVFAALPIIELISVKFHLRTIAGYQGSDRAGFLERLILDEPLNFEWWFGLSAAGMMTLFAVTIATLIFRQRQFHV